MHIYIKFFFLAKRYTCSENMFFVCAVFVCQSLSTYMLMHYSDINSFRDMIWIQKTTVRCDLVNLTVMYQHTVN